MLFGNILHKLSYDIFHVQFQMQLTFFWKRVEIPSSIIENQFSFAFHSIKNQYTVTIRYNNMKCNRILWLCITKLLPQYISLQPQIYEKITTKLNSPYLNYGGVEVSSIINRQVILEIWSFENAYLWSSTCNSAIFVCLIYLHLFLGNQTFCNIHKLTDKYLFLLQPF